MNKQEEKGFALIEVLIAASIAAMTLTVAATSLSTALTSTRRASEMQIRTIEAENILARIIAGVPTTELAEPYPDWTIEETEAVEYSSERVLRSSYKLVQLTVNHKTEPRLRFETLRVGRRLEAVR